MAYSFGSNYLELLKKSLIDFEQIGTDEYYPLHLVNPNWKTFPLHWMDRLLRTRNFRICKTKPVSAFNRLNGYDWPAQAKTMIGLERLNNIEHCAYQILNEHIPGDLIEIGVWRGGATIFMRALLKEKQVTDRKVWVADSFRGLPAPDPAHYPADKGNKLHKQRILAVPLEEVKANFQHYDLLDEQVVFLEGWFKDTLPQAPIQQLALMRLDGDLYASTIQALDSLYPKLSKGGFVIVDDYHAFPFCKKAVDDYRKEHNIKELMVEIDREAIYWRKEA